MSTATQFDGTAGPAAPLDGLERIRVWDLPTRIFHWTLALSFAGAWLTGDSERHRDLHVMFGYTFGGMLAFRLVWGLVGSRYARFSSFLFPPARIFGYLKSLLAGRPEHHPGHNPAGALAIFAMLGLGIVITASGFLNYQELGGEWLEELHEGTASVMLALVLIHIGAVVLSSYLHRENLVASMLTGWKAGAAGEGIGRPRVLVGALLLTALLGLWWAYRSGIAEPWLPPAAASVERGWTGEHDDDD